MGHADKNIGDLYDKIKEDESFRRMWARKAVLALNWNLLYRMYRKSKKKTMQRETLKLFVM